LVPTDQDRTAHDLHPKRYVPSSIATAGKASDGPRSSSHADPGRGSVSTPCGGATHRRAMIKRPSAPNFYPNRPKPRTTRDELNGASYRCWLSLALTNHQVERNPPLRRAIGSPPGPRRPNSGFPQVQRRSPRTPDHFTRRGATRKTERTGGGTFLSLTNSGDVNTPTMSQLA
jgi:hypothetical protein